MTWRQVGSRRLGRGAFLTLDRLHIIGPGGEPLQRDVVDHPGGVGILAIDGGKALMLRQYRVALGTEVVEIPAGKLDAPNETPETAAHRELKEEIGATTPNLELLGTTYTSPGYSNEVLHLYLAEDITTSEIEPDGVEEAHAEILRMPTETLLDQVRSGEITDAKTQIATLLWATRG